MENIQELQWLKQVMLANSFRDKLIELGEDNFIKWTEEQCKKSVEQYRSENATKKSK